MTPKRHPTRPVSIPNVRLVLRINAALLAQVDKAVTTGLFGHNRQQSCERLIAEGVRRLVKEGVIARDE